LVAGAGIAQAARKLSEIPQHWSPAPRPSAFTMGAIRPGPVMVMGQLTHYPVILHLTVS
jgi:hypothetical protein